MSYIHGFVAAVPAANKEAYRAHAAEAAAIAREFGASRVVEAWGDDIPVGKVTDFRRSVKAGPEEAIVFAWHEYPSKATADAAMQKMKQDPRMKRLGDDMPFDGRRLIYGGFSRLIEETAGGATGYVDGSLIAVPAASKEAYRKLAAELTTVIMEHGATRIVDAWGEDVPDGRITDCKSAVKAAGDEEVVYSWIEWPSREARDTGWEKIIADPRMYAETEPYDNSRRVHGGFRPVLDV